MPKKNSLNKLEEWKKILLNYENSGITQEEFCKKNQFKIATFKYWKAKVSNQNLIESTLIPVSILSNQEPTAEKECSGIVLELRDGMRCRFNKEFHSESFSKLLSILESP